MLLEVSVHLPEHVKRHNISHPEHSAAALLQVQLGPSYQHRKMRPCDRIAPLYSEQCTEDSMRRDLPVSGHEKALQVNHNL